MPEPAKRYASVVLTIIGITLLVLAGWNAIYQYWEHSTLHGSSDPIWKYFSEKPGIHVLYLGIIGAALVLTGRILRVRRRS